MKKIKAHKCCQVKYKNTTPQYGYKGQIAKGIKANKKIFLQMHQE